MWGETGESQKQTRSLDRESDVKGRSRGNLGGALRSEKQTEEKCCLLSVECSSIHNIDETKGGMKRSFEKRKTITR
jgi:hypothetical protein